MSEPRPHILVVEDDADIRRLVRLILEPEGYEVHLAETAARGLIEAGTRRPDLAILDLGLPDGDGVDLILQLRQWSSMPIIVLSARIREDEKIEALDAGADDYLVKPFGAGELLARIRAQLRRHAQQPLSGSSEFRFGSIRVDLLKREVERNGERIHLTPIEYRLLTVLAGQPDRVLTYRMLLQAVWGPGHTQDMHYVRVHMANLRKKIEETPSAPKYFLTEPGIGYRFVMAERQP